MKEIKRHTYLSGIISAIIFVLFLFSFQNSSSQTITVTDPAQTSVTIPAGATNIVIEVWGAGGSGGASGNNAASGGGGGGAYSRSSGIFTPGTYTIQVGTGGAQPAKNGNGIAGGNTWFDSAAVIFAEGGAGGSSSGSGGAGGAGGDAANGIGTDTTLSGSPGTAGSGTQGGNGGAGANGGAGGAGGNNTNGTAGTSPGGGGGGSGGRNNLGGAGANGQIVITYTISASCNLTDAGIANIICDDNGTASNAGDDTFTFTINPTGSNLGATYSVSGGDTRSGINYGGDELFGPFNISDGNVTITITDVDDAGCQLVDVVVTAPAPCSAGCNLTGSGLANITCDDNGTPFDTNDDRFSFTLNPTGFNLDATYTVSGDVTQAGVSYGSDQLFSFYPISGGDLTITITDDADGACQIVDLIVTAPPTCGATPCNLTASGLTNIVCSDNGTPADPSDDTFSFDLNPTGTDLGASYNVTGDVTQSGISYGSATNFSGYPISGGNLSITITDVSGNCSIVETVVPPATCSADCNISASGLTNVFCDNMGTLSDETDDEFSFDINPSGSNLGATYTVNISGVGPTQGPFAYGTKQTFNGFLISDGNRTVTITDVSGAPCELIEVVVPPSTCSLNHSFAQCTGCHIGHNAPGSNLTDIAGNALLCQSCHQNGGLATDKPLVDGNKAIPGTSGNSHSWDVPAVNATYQTVAPDPSSEMGKRMPGGNIICSTCHNQHNNGNAGTPYLRIDNTGDAMCKVCHSVRDVQRFSDGPTNKGSHPVGVFYDTADPKMDPTPGNTIIVGGNVECSSCHGLHDVQNNTLTTDGNLLRMDPDVNLCKDCHAYQDHNGYDCLTCHEVHNTVDGTIGNNIFMIRDNVDTPIGNKPVVFLAESGPNSFVDTDGTYDGICEVCHTTTLNHRADGSETLHEDSTDKREQNCVGCHFHSDRFATPSGPIDCVGCHSSAQPGGRGGVPQIVGATGEFDTSLSSRHTAAGIGNDPAVAECEACHFEPNGDHPTTRMQLRNDGANAVFDTSVNPTNNYCITCHDGASPYPALFPNLDSDPKFDKSVFSAQGGPHNYASGGAPTNNSCAVCHNRHGSANTSLLVNAANVDNCKLCHTAGQDASTMSIDTWTSGINSHAWDVNATNGTYDAAPPSQSPMSGRLEGANIVCSTCHNPHDNTDGKFLINNNPVDGLCKDCHSVRDKGTYAADNTNNRGHHPVGVVYPTATVNYQATPANLPLYTSGPDEYVECTSCHGMHPTATGNDGAGDGNLLRMANDNNLCKDCHNYNAHQGFECLDCHDPHGGGTNIMLIKDQIDIDPSAGTDLRTVVFTNQGTSNGYPADPQALNSFADGDGTYDGICEVCHTTNPSNYHYNTSAGDHTHNAGKNCTTCHPHRENDAPNVSFPNGSCHACHEEPGTPNQQYPLTGAHDIHAGSLYAYACSTCHFGSDGLSQTGHPSSTVDVVFDPTGLASRFGLDAATPTWNSADKTCSNIYCHSNGRSSFRGDINGSGAEASLNTWSGSAGVQMTPTYVNPTPRWDTGSIPKAIGDNSGCDYCHSNGGTRAGPVIGNFNPPYTFTAATAPAAKSMGNPGTGAHTTTGAHEGNSGHYTDNDVQPWNGTGYDDGWPEVMCFWCHNADTNNVNSTDPKLQGTYGTQYHVDGKSWFNPYNYDPANPTTNPIGHVGPGQGTMAPGLDRGSGTHCSSGQSCW